MSVINICEEKKKKIQKKKLNSEMRKIYILSLIMKCMKLFMVKIMIIVKLRQEKKIMLIIS